MRYYLVFKDDAEERVAQFVARIDAALGYPNAHAQSYADGGSRHPTEPWRLLVLDERAEPHLTQDERALLTSRAQLENEGWFSGDIL